MHRIFIYEKGVYERYLLHSNLASLNQQEDKATETPTFGVVSSVVHVLCTILCILFQGVGWLRCLSLLVGNARV